MKFSCTIVGNKYCRLKKFNGQKAPKSRAISFILDSNQHLHLSNNDIYFNFISFATKICIHIKDEMVNTLASPSSFIVRCSILQFQHTFVEYNIS